MSHRGRTTANERIACALAAGKSHKDAAAEAGVSTKTVFRRAADPAFAAHVAELRGAMVAAAAGQLADGMTAAAAVLRAGLTDKNANVRHKSAVKLIELGVKVAEVVELQKRVEELERAMALRTTV